MGKDEKYALPLNVVQQLCSQNISFTFLFVGAFLLITWSCVLIAILFSHHNTRSLYLQHSSVIPFFVGQQLPVKSNVEHFSCAAHDAFPLPLPLLLSLMFVLSCGIQDSSSFSFIGGPYKWVNLYYMHVHCKKTNYNEIRKCKKETISQW